MSSNSPRANYPRARLILWVNLFLLIFGVTVGGTWDLLWHVTEPFDGFWSPPHIMVYVFCTLSGFITIGMVFSGRIRVAFGEGFVIKPLPFVVPGALVILGGGIALAGLAGIVFDNIWHSSFGLDETNWSLPHAMLGWTSLMAMLGFLACRLALRKAYPMRWYTVLILGLLVLYCTTSPFMGPIQNNRTPATVQALFQIPILAVQSSSQHVFRIYQEWNLNRTNPALLILGALWAGAVLAFLRRLDNRWWLILIILALWSASDNNRNNAQALAKYIFIPDDPANWRELPLFLTGAVLLLLLWLRVPERIAWGVSGLGFGLLTFGTWMSPSVAILLVFAAIPTILIGKIIGETAFDIVEKPTSPLKVIMLVATAFIVPCVTGVIDLYLRLNTP